MNIADEKKAEEILMDIGFYRIGFYAFPFEKTFPKLENRTHEYKDNTSFEDVVDLYYFDYDLRKILTNYLSRIEVNLRTHITYTVSNFHNNSPTWFVDPNIMRPQYISEFEDKVYNDIKKNPIIKRHHNKYINDIYAPAWKTIEFMTFGNLCALFSNLKNTELQRKIAQHYNCGLGVFFSYLKTLRDIRNSCAHGACIYNMSLDKGIRSSKNVPISGNSRHNIHGIISIIKHMIGMISRNRLNDLKNELSDLLRSDRSPFCMEIIKLCTGL